MKPSLQAAELDAKKKYAGYDNKSMSYRRIHRAAFQRGAAWQRMQPPIFYNHGTTPVFIVRPNPSSDSADYRQDICVEPGEGIDLSILNFSPEKTREVK